MAVPTILLAWELGGGWGHVLNFRRLAERLRQQECHIVAAIRDLRLAWKLTEIGVHVIQAPVWPGALHEEGTPRRWSSATFTDVLATAGLVDPDAVLAILSAWLHLFRWVQPDLLVTDYAPLGALAGRGRVPVMQTGIGYALPPPSIERLPLLHRVAPPVWSDEEVLGILNGALRQTGSAMLGRLPDLFAGDDTFVTTFSLLDPYAGVRAVPANGPLVDCIPSPVHPEAEGIFVYLSPAVAMRSDVAATLQALAQDLEIFVPGLESDLLLDLAGRGARVHWQTPSLSEVLPRCRLVVHHGGAGVAAEALAVGLPQMLLPRHIEQELNAAALRKAGVARSAQLRDPAVKIAPDLIIEAVGDRQLLAQAHAVSASHRSILRNDPLGDLSGRCHALLQAH